VTFIHAHGPFITREKRTCVAGQKQIVQLVVVVVVGRHGGGGGVQLDLLEHLRRQRIRVILRIIKKRHRYASTVAQRCAHHRRSKHFNHCTDPPCARRIRSELWMGREGVFPKAFAENRAKKIQYSSRYNIVTIL